MSRAMNSLVTTSSSVWGCGLKLFFADKLLFRGRVILRVRMWIEIKGECIVTDRLSSHPPCEDVD